jgi:hypothetical protein
MVLVLVRLRELKEAATAIRTSLFAIRFPELPWPQPLPEMIIHTEWNRGHLWRLRASGQWEVQKNGVWQPADPQ